MTGKHPAVIIVSRTDYVIGSELEPRGVTNGAPECAPSLCAGGGAPGGHVRFICRGGAIDDAAIEYQHDAEVNILPDDRFQKDVQRSGHLITMRSEWAL